MTTKDAMRILHEMNKEFESFSNRAISAKELLKRVPGLTKNHIKNLLEAKRNK